MRKHSVRKWLHAILDLLPVIILPIFAIYSHRHTINDYSVSVPQNEVVEFNQLVNSTSYDSTYGVVSLDNNGLTTADLVNNDSSVRAFSVSNEIQFYSHNVYVLRVMPTGVYDTFPSDFEIFISYAPYGYPTTHIGSNSVRFSYPGSQVNRVWFQIPNGTYHFEGFINVFNLTQMFGEGNEPTLQDFDNLYPNDYYSYDLGTKQLLKGVSTVTYDNSDIGSQMMYSLYKPINDYFNLNNVFNFGAIYDWFELNMFNGNAPLSIFIVWNIIVYEFIMDIIFLIYSVFMFVIDFACETLDRFTGWAKRGD